MLQRLDKVLSGSSLVTRSQARDALRAGRVLVNGIQARDGAAKVDPEADCVTLDGQKLTGGHVVLLLNKPAGFVTSTQDPRDRTVMELLPPELWAAVGGVLLLRLSSYTLAAVKYRRFASLHTYLNKLSGAAVFAIPYGLLLPAGVPFCWAVWGTTAAASAEELLIHLREKTYCPDRKSILKRAC